MPVKNSGGDYGELHVKMIVNFPTALNAKQKEFVEKIEPHITDEDRLRILTRGKMLAS